MCVTTCVNAYVPVLGIVSDSIMDQTTGKWQEKKKQFKAYRDAPETV